MAIQTRSGKVQPNNKLPPKQHHRPAIEVVMSEGDKLLMKLCIKLLKESSPRGLTIKEMAQSILNDSNMGSDYDKIRSICKSSTVLSTKLNSFYRRCHPDEGVSSQQDKENCPIVRQQCPDVPNRLLYKYSGETEMVRPVINGPLSPPQTEHDPIPDTQEQQEDKGAMMPRLPSPSPPPAHYKLRKVIKKTPHAYTPPQRRKSRTNDLATNESTTNGTVTISSIKSEFSEVISTTINSADFANPYYDTNPTILPIIPPTSTSWILDDLDDVKSPELVSLDDLDQLLA